MVCTQYDRGARADPLSMDQACSYILLFVNEALAFLMMR